MHAKQLAALAVSVVTFGCGVAEVGEVDGSGGTDRGSSEHAIISNEQRVKKVRLREDLLFSYWSSISCYYTEPNPHGSICRVVYEYFTEHDYNSVVYSGHAAYMPPRSGETTFNENLNYPHGGDYWMVSDDNFIYEGCFPIRHDTPARSYYTLQCRYRSSRNTWRWTNYADVPNCASSIASCGMDILFTSGLGILDTVSKVNDCGSIPAHCS
ncbi:MAG: hypothetical protein K1X89_12330 [Myxococcaceae bacterium]|nr:hypothetical protein [Myxococcaceae bacterium]